MKAGVKKGINAAVTAILLAVTVFSVVVLVFSLVVRAKGDSGLFGLKFYHIVSGSMEPQIHVGDIVVARYAALDDVQPGDVVVFRYAGKIVTHTLVSINPDGTFTTEGAANNGAQENSPASALIAKKVGRIPYGGKIVDFIRAPYGFVLIVLLPLACLLVYQSAVLTKQVRAYGREKKNEPDREELKKEIRALKERLDNDPNANDREKK